MKTEKPHIVIVGGSGNMGSNLTEYLTSNFEYTVTNIDVKKSNISSDFIYSGLENQEITNQVFKNIYDKHGKNSVVFHFAGLGDKRQCATDPEKALRTNVLLALYIVNACKRFGFKKIVFPSSAHIYSPENKTPISEYGKLAPDSIYAAVKISTENIIQNLARETEIFCYILRISNIYGSASGNNTVVGILLNQVVKKPDTITMMKLKPRRDYVYIKDLLPCLQKIIGHDSRNQMNIYNISSNESQSVYELCQIACKCMGISCNIKSSMDDNDDSEIILSNLKIKKELNWCPRYSIEEGIDESINLLTGVNV